LPRRRLDDERHAEEVQALRPGGWYNHQLAQELWNEPGAPTG
jgi:hypothetical protein